MISEEEYKKVIQKIAPIASSAESRIKKDLHKVKDEVLKNLYEQIESVHSQLSENMRKVSTG